MALAQYFIPAIAGLLSGAIGSLIAPWVQWGIEAKREQMKARRTLLAEIRAILSDPPPVAEFRKLPLYFQVKDLLSKSTNEAINGQFDNYGNEIIQIRVGGPYRGVNPYAHLVLCDLALLEKKWQLL